MRKRRANGRNDVRHQARESAHVVFAVIQDVALFLSVERWALQNALAHVVLARNVDLILKEISQRAADRIKAFLAVAAFYRAVIHVVPELDVGIERTRRFAPTQRSVNTEFGGEHVADDQRVVVEAVRRERAKLVLPQPNEPARSHLQSDETKRRNGVTRYAAIGQARTRIELGIDDPDFTERQIAPIRDRRHRR